MPPCTLDFFGTGQVGLQGKAQSISLVLAPLTPLYQLANVVLIVWFPTRNWVHVSSYKVWQWTRHESANIPVVLDAKGTASCFKNSCSNIENIIATVCIYTQFDTKTNKMSCYTRQMTDSDRTFDLLFWNWERTSFALLSNLEGDSQVSISLPAGQCHTVSWQ